MTIESKIFYTGAHFTVECAIENSGASSSHDFLKELDVSLKAKITSVIKRFADHGRISNQQHFKKVEGDIWEFKHYQTRILMYHFISEPFCEWYYR